jgi:hypothetical protein
MSNIVHVNKLAENLMKSIKEKSNEYAREYLFNPLSQRAPDEYFEAGANYVLECIEDIIVNNEDNTLNMARCLVDCIEQLKK